MRALVLDVPRLLVVLAVLLAGCRQGPIPRDGREPGVSLPDKPDVVLVTIDTLRADALSFTGNRRVETPVLDGLAREGWVFTSAHAHNVVTLPSHVNILTGLLPYQHGVRDNSGFRLASSIPTIAVLLKPRGYATGAFIGAFPLDRRFGLAPGFDLYDDRCPSGQPPRSWRPPQSGGPRMPGIPGLCGSTSTTAMRPIGRRLPSASVTRPS